MTHLPLHVRLASVSEDRDAGLSIEERVLLFLEAQDRLVSELKFLIKMPLRRNRNINDVNEQAFEQHIVARIEERLDQFIDQLADRMNNMMNSRRRGNHNGRRNKCEELENPFFEEEENNLSFMGVMLGVEEESMPVYDTDIEVFIEEKEVFVRKGGFHEEEDSIEEVVVVAIDLCSSMIQTTLSVDFEEDINTKSLELMPFGKKIERTLANLDNNTFSK
ncbi:hypothetical protein Tco_1444804 [Tanacetum coccineum]